MSNLCVCVCCQLPLEDIRRQIELEKHSYRENSEGAEKQLLAFRLMPTAGITWLRALLVLTVQCWVADRVECCIIPICDGREEGG